MKRLLIALLVTFCSNPFQAQDATLQGTLTDESTGETLIGVNVTHAPGKGTATDVEGRYRLVLPPGEHTITFSSVGFTTLRENILLAAGEERVLDITLPVAAAQLDMVVVSAGKFEQRVGEVTQSLTVLRPDIILNKNITELSAALDQVPGVVIMDNDPQIRAGSGFSYGAGSRVMMLVDDLPILSGDVGRPSWVFLPIENIEQVEVIKGASSVLYGSAALSGVINVRTAYPRSEPRTRVTAFTGIYDTPRNKDAKWWNDAPPIISGVNFYHAQQYGQLDLVLGGNAFTDQGFVGPEPIPADSIAADPLRLGQGGFDQRVRTNVGLRWRDRKVKGLSYGVNANAMKSAGGNVLLWQDIDEGIMRPQPGTLTRTLGTQAYVDPFITYYSEQGVRHSLRTRYYSQVFDNDNEQSNRNRFLYGEYQMQKKVQLLGETMITAGLMGQRTRGEAELYSGNPEGDGVNEALNTAAYLQVDKRLFGSVMLSGGIRYERFEVNDDEQSQPVFRAGATWQVMEATYLRASYGQGFRFPTIGERFIRTSVGSLNIYPNNELQAERSWNLEAGIKQGFKLGGFTGYFDAVVFQQEYEDFIEFTFGQWATPTTQNLFGLGFSSVNTGGARVTGYELELVGRGAIGGTELAMLIGWTHTLPISTTPDQIYARPEFEGAFWPEPSYANTSYDASDNILKFRVERMFRADLQADHKRLALGVSVRYNSHVRNIDNVFVQLDEAEIPAISLETGVGQWMAEHRSGDTVLDARIGLRIGEKNRVFFIVNNLTNVEYATRPMALDPPRNMQVQLSVEI